MSCIFCKIIEKELPSTQVYEDEEIIAFKDISPKAPVHILIVPKKHIDRVENIEEEDSLLMGKLIFTAKKIAQEQGLKKGFRLVFNNGKDGGQEVEHIHLHLLGGKKLKF